MDHPSSSRWIPDRSRPSERQRHVRSFRSRPRSLGLRLSGLGDHHLRGGAQRCPGATLMATRMIAPPLTDADQRSLALQALQNQRRPEEEVSVGFTTTAMSQREWLTSIRNEPSNTRRQDGGRVMSDDRTTGDDLDKSDDAPSSDAVASRASGSPPEEATSDDPTAHALTVLEESEKRTRHGARPLDSAGE